jgi:hypothetical protein
MEQALYRFRLPDRFVINPIAAQTKTRGQGGISTPPPLVFTPRGYGERAGLILKYFLFGGLSLLGMLFAVDSWIETETLAVAMAALVAIARHGDRTLQPELAIREERPVPRQLPTARHPSSPIRWLPITPRRVPATLSA